MPECIFCTYQTKFPELVLHVMDHFFVIPNAFPTAPKYLLIVSKEHYDNNFTLEQDIWFSLQETINQAMALCWDNSVFWIDIYNQIIDVNLHHRSILSCQKMIHSEFLLQKPTGYNIGLNIGADAGQTINHFHLHILPRYHLDSTEPCGIGQIIK